MIELVLHQDADVPNLAENRRVLGFWQEPLHEDLALFRILTRSEKAEAIVNELQSRYENEPDFRLLILEVEATIPQPPLDDADDREQAEDNGQSEQQQEQEGKDPHRISCAELVQKISEGAAPDRIYAVTVALSTIVVTIGLLRDNVAVIIGGMVIAPLLKPNMMIALAATLGDSHLARKSVYVNAVGIALTLAIAAAVGFFVTVDATTGEIAKRTSVALPDLGLSFAAGAAGALAFTTGLSAAVVGVMVAVALLPPLATSGLLLGDQQWLAATDALLLTAVNILCVNLAAVATFFIQGVRPRHWWEEDRARKMTIAATATWLLLLALLTILIILGSD